MFRAGVLKLLWCHNSVGLSLPKDSRSAVAVCNGFAEYKFQCKFSILISKLGTNGGKTGAGRIHSDCMRNPKMTSMELLGSTESSSKTPSLGLSRSSLTMIPKAERSYILLVDEKNKFPERAKLKTNRRFYQKQKYFSMSALLQRVFK